MPSDQYNHFGWVSLPLSELGLDPNMPFQVHDLLSDSRCLWHSQRKFIALNPLVKPAHILRIRKKLRTENDFDYFLKRNRYEQDIPEYFRDER